MLGEILTALHRNEMKLAYQPVTNLKTNQIEGYEAFIRWPFNGFTVMPRDLLPDLEQTGLVDRLDEWVLRTVLKSLEHDQKRASSKPLSISINVSPVSLEKRRFIRKAARIIASSGAIAKSLTVQVTNSYPVSNPRRIRFGLHELQNCGVSTTLDNIGETFSPRSSSHFQKLKEIPTDHVTMNCALFAKCHPKNRYKMMRKLIDSLKDQGKEVVVKRVEILDQYEAARFAGADYVQGHLLGLPRYYIPSISQVVRSHAERQSQIFVAQDLVSTQAD